MVGTESVLGREQEKEELKGEIVARAETEGQFWKVLYALFPESGFKPKSSGGLWEIF